MRIIRDSFLYALAITAVMAVVTIVRAPAATQATLTVDMVRNALRSAHVCIDPGCELQMIDQRQGAAGWHTFRLDAFSIRVRGGHFVIEGDTSRLN